MMVVPSLVRGRGDPVGRGHGLPEVLPAAQRVADGRSRVRRAESRSRRAGITGGPWGTNPRGCDSRMSGGWRRAVGQSLRSLLNRRRDGRRGTTAGVTFQPRTSPARAPTRRSALGVTEVWSRPARTIRWIGLSSQRTEVLQGSGFLLRPGYAFQLPHPVICRAESAHQALHQSRYASRTAPR